MEVNIKTIIKSIKSTLESNHKVFDQIGIGYGLAGLSAFNLIYSKCFEDRNASTQGIEYLSTLIEKLNDGYKSDQLFVELLEIGNFTLWCIEQKINIELNELLNELNDILEYYLLFSLEEKNFDPIIGAIGFGNYFLKQINKNNNSKLLVEKLVIAINDCKLVDNSGYYWQSKIKPNNPIYLGSSHGNAAVIKFLIKASKFNFKIDSDDLIVKAANYILCNQLQNNPYLFFPVKVGEPVKIGDYPNNWCYGDPGTIDGLIQAAKHVGNHELLNYCNDLYSKVIQRKLSVPYIPTGYSMAYGYSGLAILYYRIFKLTKCEMYKKSYESILAQVSNQFDSKDPFLGYQSYWNQSIPVTNLSFHEGLIGIGMSLMTLINDQVHEDIKSLFCF